MWTVWWRTIRWQRSAAPRTNTHRAVRLASGADVHADVFKAAHHGSSTSNTQAFLDAVRPQAVVVSCGAGNSYGHPHSEALAAFANVGAQVYRTDTEGTIIAYVDKAGVLQMAVSRQEAA